MEIVQLDTDDFIGIERQRPNVKILFVTFGANQLEQGIDHFICGMLQFHTKQFRGLQETPEMILRTEHEKLLLILIPVRPETAKNRGSVVEGVRQYADLNIGIRYDTASEEHVFGHCHGFTPRILKSGLSLPQ